MIAEATAMVGQLESSLGLPTFAFFANWSGEYAVDADEEAGRLLSALIVERLRREEADEIALILGARGGYPAFADTVLRTLRQLEVKAQAIVTCRVDGAIAILATGCDQITLHPQGGIGALDSGLLVVPRRELNAALLPFWPVDPFDASSADNARSLLAARLANDALLRDEQRRLARRTLPGGGLSEGKQGALQRGEALFSASLGSASTMDACGLEELGLTARVAPGPLAEQLEELLRWADAHLQLFRRPEQRFQVSNAFADEVEFEPATQVEAAAIVSSEAAYLHELDTGSPDPDAPRLKGKWRGSEPSATLGSE